MMNWFKNQVVHYMFRRIGIVFATTFSGYAATLLYKHLRLYLEKPAIVAPVNKRKRKRKVRRRHHRKKCKGTTSTTSSSSSSSSSN